MMVRFGRQGIGCASRAFGRALAVAIVAATLLAGGVASAAPPAGGGFVATYQSLSLRELNNDLQSSGFPALPESMWVLGGGGHGPLRRSGGLVFGGFGGGGELRKAGSGGKAVWLDVGYGGPWVGYQREVAGPVSLQAGLGLAFGSAVLTVFTGPDPDTFSPGTPNQVTYSRFIFALVPDVAVSWALTPFMHLQAGVGYFFDTQAGGGWKSARGYDLSKAPGDSFSGVQYRLAVVWGPERPSDEEH